MPESSTARFQISSACPSQVRSFTDRCELAAEATVGGGARRIRILARRLLELLILSRNSLSYTIKLPAREVLGDRLAGTQVVEVRYDCRRVDTEFPGSPKRVDSNLEVALVPFIVTAGLPINDENSPIG